MKRCLLLGCFLAYATSLPAQTNPAVSAARQWRQNHEGAIIDEFFSLVAIPDVTSDKANIRRNAEVIAGMMEKRDVPAKLLTVPGSNPIVFGEIKTPGATRTIVFYAHYDGQPLDPKEWATPPFQPTLRDGMIENKPGDPATCPWRPFQSGVADLCPGSGGRQGSDYVHTCSVGCNPRSRTENEIQH